MNAVETIQEQLFALQDTKYRDFTARLIPTVAPADIIGVRTPNLRKLARSLAGTPEAAAFLETLPHRYYEENNLHAFLIETIKDYDACIRAVDAFLPYVNNWATCDSMSPKAFKKHLPELIEKIRAWTASGQTYTIRFGLGMLMNLYLDAEFRPEYLDIAADLRSGEYYVNMMIAWYFATALAKQYDASLPYIRGRRLDTWTHNKAIQKAIESYRVTEDQKAVLRAMKIK